MRRATTGTTAGLLAMAATIVVWAGFALSIRGIGSSSLTGMDVAVLRFGIPVVMLSPWIPRTIRRLRSERPVVVAGICIGAGLPYFLVSALGGSLTSATLVGQVIPGTVPVFVAALAFAIWRARIRRVQALALVAILAGVAITVVLATTPSGAAGIGVLLAAGLIWAVYTLSLRSTGLDPIGAALVLCVPSAIGALVLAGGHMAPSHLADGTARPGDVVFFLAVQGLGVGVVAALSYAFAIRRLGPRAAATLGALSPVLTATVAVPVFGEPLGPAAIASLALVVAGVVAFNLLAPAARRVPPTDPAAEPVLTPVPSGEPRAL